MMWGSQERGGANDGDAGKELANDDNVTYCDKDDQVLGSALVSS